MRLRLQSQFLPAAKQAGRHSLLATSSVSYASLVELGEAAARKLIPFSNDTIHKRTDDAVSDIRKIQFRV